MGKRSDGKFSGNRGINRTRQTCGGVVLDILAHKQISGRSPGDTCVGSRSL